MDAVEYLKVKTRMCKSISSFACIGCPLNASGNIFFRGCANVEKANPVEAVKAVENWAKEHIKTRQSEFLKHFPNAKTGVNGGIAICPANFDKDICGGYNAGIDCTECQKRYWSQEVSNEDEC